MALLPSSRSYGFRTHGIHFDESFLHLPSWKALFSHLGLFVFSLSFTTIFLTQVVVASCASRA